MERWWDCYESDEQRGVIIRKEIGDRVMWACACIALCGEKWEEKESKIPTPKSC